MSIWERARKLKEQDEAQEVRLRDQEEAQRLAAVERALAGEERRKAQRVELLEQLGVVDALKHVVEQSEIFDELKTVRGVEFETGGGDVIMDGISIGGNARSVTVITDENTLHIIGKTTQTLQLSGGNPATPKEIEDALINAVAYPKHSPPHSYYPEWE